jgi:hypothetical protein
VLVVGVFWRLLGSSTGYQDNFELMLDESTTKSFHDFEQLRSFSNKVQSATNSIDITSQHSRATRNKYE